MFLPSGRTTPKSTQALGTLMGESNFMNSCSIILCAGVAGLETLMGKSNFMNSCSIILCAGVAGLGTLGGGFNDGEMMVNREPSKLESLEAQNLGSLEAWKFGSLGAWKLGSLEALWGAKHLGCEAL